MNKIFLGAQLGGADAGKKFSAISVSIRKKLEILPATYCKEIDNFQITLRVSGEITTFKESNGVHYLRLLKKRRTITADIVISEEIWVVKNQRELTDYLSFQIVEAITLMCKRIENEKMKMKTQEIIDGLKFLLWQKGK